MSLNATTPGEDQYSLPTPQGVAGAQGVASPQQTPATGLPQAVNTPAPIPVPSSQPAGNGAQSIDPAWVERAKQIMMSSIDDPYRLSKEFSLLKADYIKRTYGKTLKTNEEQSA